ncbi:hypothetical protein T484DRAFT_1934716 [Baffinella frigidus]|nr:hypothetical protein T484DRAFT_1934716 [Cryptophyta sp. CCMP2293]
MATPDDRVKELESHAAALSTQLEASKSREAALAKELSAANLKLKLADESGKESERRLASQEREQQLVVSLMYDLAEDLHRTKTLQRANLDQPPLQSWLASRRQDLAAPPR